MGTVRARSLTLSAFVLAFVLVLVLARDDYQEGVTITEDAIIVEAWDPTRHRRSPDASPGYAGSVSRLPLPHPPCFTAAGQLGRCTSFRECYPYFKIPDIPTWGTWMFGNQDACSYFGEQIRQPDVFQTFGVCCTSPVVSSPTAEARPAPVYLDWPPPLPPLPTHPPNHAAPTHPPSAGFIPGVTKPSADETTTKTSTTTHNPWTTTWGTKATTTYKPWQPTAAPTTTTVSNVMGDSGHHQQHGKCGAKNGYQDQERIVGGQNADVNEWPWIAGLFNGGRQFCGGSLIDSQHIVTAAHCVAQMTPYDVSRLTVRLGDHNIKTHTEVNHIEKKALRVIRHRNFDMRTLYFDVAVIKMDSPVQFSKQIRPVCLPSSTAPQYAGTTATVIGWGSLRESGPQPSVLQKVSIPIWSNTECRMKYGSAAPGGIVDHMICAGQSNKDSCSGDSGGPLMVNEGGSWTQVGIVSWGIGCGKGQYPGVYSRVTVLLPWIRKNCS